MRLAMHRSEHAIGSRLIYQTKYNTPSSLEGRPERFHVAPKALNSICSTYSKRPTLCL